MTLRLIYEVGIEWSVKVGGNRKCGSNFFFLFLSWCCLNSLSLVGFRLFITKFIHYSLLILKARGKLFLSEYLPRFCNTQY